MYKRQVKHLLDQGFQNVSVEPVVTSPEYDYALRDEDIERILIEYDLSLIHIFQLPEECFKRSCPAKV